MAGWRLLPPLTEIYALDPSSGAVIPPYPYDSAEINSKKDPIRAAPVQAGELIVVTTESGRVIAVKDAQRQWYWPSGVPTASILTTPVVSEGKVYVVLTRTVQSCGGNMHGGGPLVAIEPVISLWV